MRVYGMSRVPERFLNPLPQSNVSYSLPHIPISVSRSCSMMHLAHSQ